MEWDVKIDDQITYFDPNLSYEITGYRPINKTSGLDFDPEWFIGDATHKLEKGTYSPIISAKYGSKSHIDFWKERYRRCIEGYTVKGYRITGDNYFWLNFYRLKQSAKKKKGEKKAKAGAGRNVSFPSFFVYQYEYFHYVDLCEELGYDVGLLKSRGIGFSEAGACLCSRPYITTPNYRVVASAFSDKLLKPLLSKIWSQIDWLNLETEGAFKRVRMSQNTAMYKRASKLDKDGNQIGHMSEIEGLVADSAEKIRGDRTERLLFEEAGSDKIFKQKWIQGEALVNVMGDKIGTRFGWGTGGDAGKAIEGIKEMTTDPEVFNILPYRHNHTPSGEFIYTSMFIPAYVTVKNLMDDRGWCDPDKGKEFYDVERSKKVSNPTSLLMYKAEYCYTIEEALIQQGDNVFPREELAEQKAQIEIYKNTPKPNVGWLTWVRDENDENIGVKWQNRDTGKILILEHPLKTEEGHDYKNLYVGGIDSIDIGKDDSSTLDESKLSEFCIVIKKRVFGQSNPEYVAIYKHRPRDPREAYDIAAKLLIYYNCKAVLETTRTAIISHFKSNKFAERLLMKRPKATMPNISRVNANMYGTPTPKKVIEHYIELIYDFILDYSHTIGFIEMVDQLLNYSDEQKRKFDIIAAMGMAELGDEELSVRRPEPAERINEEFKDIGWFTDGKGYKHYGIIPKTEEERNERNRIRTSDTWLHTDYL